MQLRLLAEVVGLTWKDSGRFVRWRLAAALLLVVSGSVLNALGPLALKWLVDGFTGQAARPKTEVSSFAPLALVGLYSAGQFLARAAGEMRGLVYARAERRILRDLSERFFGHVLRLPLRFHLQRKTGGLSQSLENGLLGYQMILHHLVFTLLPVTFELATITVVLMRVGRPVLLGLFCGALGCYGIVFEHAARVVVRSARRASSAEVEAAGQMTDALFNVELVKYFAAESAVQRRIGSALSRTETEWVGFYRRYAVNGLRVAAIFAAFLAVTTLHAVREVEGARWTVGEFVLITTYMLQVIRPVEAVGYAMQGFSQGAAMLETMLALFHESAELQQAEAPRDKEGVQGKEELVPYKGAGELEFKDVWLSYEPRRAVLRGVSFKIAAGKTLGIVGPSGSGKSTLARMLMRLLEPDSGRILLDGVPIAELPLTMLRGAVALVPQEAMVFNDSVAANIAVGGGECSLADIERAARQARLHEFIESLSDGYETNVGERGLKLSGGERQRLSIARAAIRCPRIYIFDEATSALDATTEAAIAGVLREMSCGTTTLVITHRLATVEHADEIIVLQAGAVVERGTHSGLLALGGWYAASWETQCGAVQEPSPIHPSRRAERRL